MNSVVCIKKWIEKIVKMSSVPEDPIHSKNTLNWLLKLYPNSSLSLQIAALGHDIERAVDSRKVRWDNYDSFDYFKCQHALNSATIIREIMKDCGAGRGLIDEVYYLVLYHESGGSEKNNLLMEVDSLSFFDVNLPLFYKRNSINDTEKRILWGLERLSSESVKLVSGFRYENKELEGLLKSCIAENIRRIGL